MKLNKGAIIGLVGGLVGTSIGFATIIITGDIISGIIFSVVFIFVGTIMYRVFIKPNMEYTRIIKTGKQATATILSITETGTRINNQPLVKFEVQVELPGVPAYTTTAKSVISYLQVSQFQPGTKVPVMVDSANNMKIVFIRQGDIQKPDLYSQASEENIAALKEKLEELQKTNDLIKTTGTYCKAIVTKFTNMGVNVNGNNPLVTIEVQVLPNYEPAFSATVKGAIKESSIPLFQPGEEIFVKYDPNDKTKVAIEHS